MRAEVNALCSDYDFKIASLQEPAARFANHLPYRLIPDTEEVIREVERFQPDVLHTHYLPRAALIHRIASRTQVPYTIRAHSFDTVRPNYEIPKAVHNAVSSLNSDLCLGVLTFPFTRPVLEKAGVKPEKIVDCFPAVDFRAFLDPSPNGDAVMNVGSGLLKKHFEDFMALAARFPETEFNLYSVAHGTERLRRFNEEHGCAVTMKPRIEPECMPVEYKKHRWLVYTACRDLGTVGWPVAVAEAQASGVGVCVPNLRPDLKEYVGGAGFLYDSIDEVARIISQPYPEEMRELGFQQAARSDIQRHKRRLTALWDAVMP